MVTISAGTTLEEGLAELLLVCRVNSIKISKKTRGILRDVLKSAVNFFEFAHAGLILVVNEKIGFGFHVSRAAAGTEEQAAPIHYNRFLTGFPEGGSQSDFLPSLQPSAYTTIPVVLSARDPVGTMEIALFDAPAIATQNLLKKATPLGRHVASIIQESVFSRQKDRTFRKLSVWLETVSTINSTLNLNQVLHVVAQLTADLFNARCAIFLFEENDRTIIPAVAVGSFDQDLKKKFKAQKGMPLFPAFKMLMKDREPVVFTPENIESGMPREIIEDFSYSWVAMVPLVSKSNFLGVMQVDRPLEAKGFDQEEVAIISAIARETSIAMENARLVEALAQKEKILQQLLEKSISSQEDERKRVASEIHDGVIQAMLGIWYRMQNLSTSGCDLKEMKKELVRLKDMLGEQISDIRKIVYNLRPVILDTYGLGPAIRALLRTLQEESKIQFELAIEGPNKRLPANFEVTLYRIIQELLANVVKHAQATRCQVMLINGQETTVLVVKDNGVGFAPSRPARDRPYGNLGLASIRERILLLEGSCKVESRLGWGTEVTITVPTPSAG
ncbi:MAG: GAF domain-containing sensor histidine kinase [Peptococcaceae bacterium]|nr:GAF domain-containing sensor histidine kinase [Peptococcaceae bacterium]